MDLQQIDCWPPSQTTSSPRMAAFIFELAAGKPLNLDSSYGSCLLALQSSAAEGRQMPADSLVIVKELKKAASIIS